MNEFMYSVVVLCTVCAVLECLVPKEHGQIKTFIGIFAIIGIIGFFGLFEGFELPEINYEKYEDLSGYALEKAYRDEILKLAEPYKIVVTEILIEDGKVKKVCLTGERNDEFEEKLIALFRCEVLYV